MGSSFGQGVFYENELWDIRGVEDTKTQGLKPNYRSEFIKLGTYASAKYQTDKKFDFDVSLYYQNKVLSYFTEPRLAASTSIKYNFTEHLGARLLYQNIYDPNPIVPIDKLFHKAIFSVDISF